MVDGVDDAVLLPVLPAVLSLVAPAVLPVALLAVVPVAAAGTVPGTGDASTREVARKPRPTAAAADAVHALPRRRVRFMGEDCRRSG